MTLEEYRIKHSMLIEQYQWIEFDLENLYAALSNEPFHKAVQEIEKDNIGGVVREIKAIEKQRNMIIFTEDEYAALDHIRLRRNFWTHACYTEAFDKSTGVPMNAGMLSTDLEKAEGVLKRLRQIKDVYMIQNRGKLIQSFFS